MAKRIAVIGGGPKAAALCAKVACLREGGSKLRISVFEKDELGAAWSGNFGYTDGLQRLCTLAERDVGFPYHTDFLEEPLSAILHARFSWPAYLMNTDDDGRGVSEWVNRGRRPPSHGEFADYIRWVIERSGATVKLAEVTGIARPNGKWAITTTSLAGRKQTYNGFDGVVVTGPGPAKGAIAQAHGANPRVTDGQSFWEDPFGFLNHIPLNDDPIVIVGSGGTAAAIAAWISRQNDRQKIIIIGSQAALFTRTDSLFENTLFTDEDTWKAISPKERTDFTERLNRGVVWASVSQILAESWNISFRPGRVTGLSLIPNPGGGADDLLVDHTDALGAHQLGAAGVIDGAGFDAWWFVNLLAPALRSPFLAAPPRSQGKVRTDLAEAMREDLSLDIGFDGFHAPMLSQAVGPGFASLMVLGSMSDRILRLYR